MAADLGVGLTQEDPTTRDLTTLGPGTADTGLNLAGITPEVDTAGRDPSRGTMHVRDTTGLDLGGIVPNLLTTGLEDLGIRIKVLILMTLANRLSLSPPLGGTRVSIPRFQRPDLQALRLVDKFNLTCYHRERPLQSPRTHLTQTLITKLFPQPRKEKALPVSPWRIRLLGSFGDMV